MAKILRKAQKIFGSGAGFHQIAQFGSLAAAAPAFSTDPDVIQALAEFTEGWFASILGGDSPAIEDMNALCYLFAYQLAYIFQAGVPEWDAATTYYIGSIVNAGGQLFYSIVDNNTNNPVSDATKWSAPGEIDARSGYSFDTAVATNAMTITMKGVGGGALSTTNVAKVTFRSATPADGTNSVGIIAAPLSVVIPSGATLGLANAQDEAIYIYALNNAGVVELAVSANRIFDERYPVNTTLLDGSSTSRYVLYSGTARTGVAIRYLGRVISNQPTSGTYTVAATNSSTMGPSDRASGTSSVTLYGDNGAGSSSTKIRRFSTIEEQWGDEITYSDDASLGGLFQVNKGGLYHCTFSQDNTGAFAITVNNTEPTTVPQSKSQFLEVYAISIAASDRTTQCSFIRRLKTGDVVTGNVENGGSSSGPYCIFSLTRLSD